MKTAFIILMIIGVVLILIGLSSAGSSKKRREGEAPEIHYTYIVPSIFDLFRRK